MTAPAGYFQVSYKGDLRIRKTPFQIGRLLLLLICLTCAPLFVSNYALNVGIAILIAIPGALALSMLTGVAGQISLGNAAFMGIGGMLAGILGGQYGWPFPLVLLAAGFVSGAIGALVGIPSLRVRGLYLIIATLSLHFVIQFAIQKVQGLQVGVAGWLMPVPSIGGFDVATPTGWYFVFLIYAIIITLVHVNVVRTRVGRAWAVIRERDIAGEIIGIPVAWYKITAFILSSVIIGIQGALSSYFLGIVSYEMFSITVAIAYVAMVIIGGLGSHVGAIYGAVFVTGLPFLLPRVLDVLPTNLSLRLETYVFDIQTLLYGLLVIVFLLFEPRGVVEITRRVRKYFTLWPFSRERLAEEEK